MVDSLVRNGDVVVDAGADWGVYSARLADLVGPTGRVHAFEPNPVSRDRLETVVGPDSHVRVHPFALSDRDGAATLHVPRDGGEAVGALGSLSARADDVPYDTVEVATVTLDAALGDDADRVSFVKIDVEGHELPLLHGAQRTLATARPALLVEIEHRHSGRQMTDTFEHLAGLGYVASAIGPGGLVPLHGFDLERDQLAYLDGGFQGEMPREYVHDFLFVPAGQSTPSSLSASAIATRAASQE